ncbi:MAG TPA: rod shape-determining protein RodA [Bacillota bacterium]|jgi:rod shape determining protein RodA
MFERRLWRNLDYPLLMAVIMLMIFGILIIGSATRSGDVSADPLYYVKRQILFAALGLVAILMIQFFDYGFFGRLANVLYGLNLAGLLVVAFVGRSALGGQRWIDIGFFRLQPSEIGKVLIIITLAGFLRRREGRLGRPQDLIGPFIYAAIPVVLVLRQPDLGTSLVFVAILFGMLYMAGARARQLATIAGAGLLVVAAILFLHFRYTIDLPIIRNFLRDYQMKRLVVFIDPSIDPLGSGYHIIQSKIAVGSGGLFGKGLFAGTQNQLNFLPEQHTDFIFAVVSEELGFLGAIGLLVVYAFIIFRGIQIMAHAKDTLGTLLAAGVVTMLTFHVLVNVGMVAGIMPVTGIPLPFMSAGGSSLLANAAAIGLLLNVGMRRQKILF